jgi:4-hydroxythreonine-4-phosphate dehydrogenase
MWMMKQPALFVKLGITTGEPAGVGPEVSLAAAMHFVGEQNDVELTLLGDSDLLTVIEDQSLKGHERIKIESSPLAAAVVPGILNPSNAQYVLHLLNEATDACLQGRFDAMITAPVQKSLINATGIPFTGHTEYLAQRCNTERVVMMLCAPLPRGFLGIKAPRDLRVALVTTHLPLKEVSAAITYKQVLETIQIVAQDLRKKFGIAKPVIRVAGLNPHAGESGYLGHEEIEEIAPAIEFAKNQGINVSGPFPGDTMFDATALEQVDAFIAMYHDQGLAPFKFVTFGGGVNVTLGLPIIRTSVDHGTALDIAGKGIADFGSMLEAIRLAYQLAIIQRKSS